jgi:hypothetical protein
MSGANGRETTCNDGRSLFVRVVRALVKSCIGE